MGKRDKKERDDRMVSAALRKIRVEEPSQGTGKRRRKGKKKKEREKKKEAGMQTKLERKVYL